ncbi:hypothetical protein F2P79_002163 [Pimephales promelas]|nr:hypothetical protein F2P79_002163 [Pimephales promelas]
MFIQPTLVFKKELEHLSYLTLPPARGESVYGKLTGRATVSKYLNRFHRQFSLSGMSYHSPIVSVAQWMSSLSA